MQEVDTGVLQPWYADDAAMRGPARRNAKLLCALIEKGPCHRYFLDPEKSWHIYVEGREEVEAREAFDVEGLKVCCKRGQRYLSGFCGGREEMEEWLLPKVAKWEDIIETLSRFAVRYQQTALCCICDVTPGGMAIPNVDLPGGQRVHDPFKGGTA